MKKILAIITTLLMPIILLTGCRNVEEKDESFKIVTSFYPVYIATLNITDGANNVKVENMTSNQVGCLHEYTLKTDDMLKIENADVFVQNGKGLESFMDKLLLTYSNLDVINSSENIESENPHVWVNPEFYIKQVKNIKNKLSELNPENKELYEKNANEYINKINKELESLKIKSNISAITFNETLENISNNIDLTVIETGHEETSLSAGTLSSIIEKMKQENIKAIFVDKNEEYRNADVLKNETEALIYTLDSYTKGELDKDSYIHALRKNIDTLNSI